MEIVVSIFSLIVAALTLCHSLFISKQAVKRNKKQATLDAINVLQVQVFDELNDYTNSKISEISQNNRSEEYKKITKLMARIEHFSVGVNSDIYSLKVTKRLAGRYFCALYEKLLPMVERKRTTFKNDKHYDEFEMLVKNLNNLYLK